MPVPSLTLVDGLFQLSFLLHDKLARLADGHGLSMAQVRLLGILRDREPGMQELCGYLQLEKSSLSGLVDRAQQRGLVERVPSRADRRAANIRVTAKGRKLSQRLEQAAGAEAAALLRGLRTPERKQLAALVERLLLEAGGQLSAGRGAR